MNVEPNADQFGQDEPGAGGDDDFQIVTELPGEPVSQLQIDRLLSRYLWAAGYCRDRDVVEAACGAGPGLGLLGAESRSLEAGDLSKSILARARAHYGTRFPLKLFDAQDMPFEDHSKDVLVLFEALYYLPSAEKFVAECRRVLRPGGRVLVATVNKDLWDFHPSAFSVAYYGVPELKSLFETQGFTTEFFGFEPVDRLPLVQSALRHVKRFAVTSGLMPRTMAGKRWLKRIVYGPQVPMPDELAPGDGQVPEPIPLPGTQADTVHRVIYCTATLQP
jgi:SAM-dependent methyltransferase